MKIPGPDHPITIAPTGRPVTVDLDGATLVRSDDALMLSEASYPPVQYLPRADADMSRLERSDRKSYCPYKGEASYFHVVVGERRLENAVWSYEDPYPAVAEIKDRLAFYPDKVRIVVGPR
jgi:uncharacterized protein (DUF427 family)